MNFFLRGFTFFLASLSVVSWAQSPEAPAVRASFIRHGNELYSESYYRKDLDAGMTQTRVRHLLQLGDGPWTLYGGINVDRMIAPNAPLLIENSLSPHVGVWYRPFSFLTAWLEYRHRFREQNKFTEKRDESDPRAGVALGHNHLSPSRRWGWDLYGETVAVPRLTDSFVGSGYARLYAGRPFAEKHRADLYAEWNEYLNEDPASLGPSRHQLRAGARWAYAPSGWSVSLFAYKPWTTRKTAGSSRSEDFEALLVIGGFFP